MCETCVRLEFERVQVECDCKSCREGVRGEGGVKVRLKSGKSE